MVTAALRALYYPWNVPRIPEDFTASLTSMLINTERVYQGSPFYGIGVVQGGLHHEEGNRSHRPSPETMTVFRGSHVGNIPAGAGLVQFRESLVCFRSLNLSMFSESGTFHHHFLFDFDWTF